MSKRRRMFEIELPDELGDAPTPAGSGGPDADRRGPMASAVRETAESLRTRSEAEAAIRAENDALAHEYVRLQGQGLVMTLVPVDAVAMSKLSRDRRDLNADGLDELKASIRAIGLSNPIQVEAAEDGGFELVQGLRRLTAFRQLHKETGDAAWSQIPAVVLAPGETLDGLYRRMVDENLIRTDISFAEMAALARSYADDPATGADTVDAAVQALFQSAGKQKRSYIRAFAKLLAELGPHLNHPEAMPRALGLAVRKRMEEAPESVATLQRVLVADDARDAEAELALLRAYAEGNEMSLPASRKFPAGNRNASARPASRRARTTFQLDSRLGPVKCSASPGRLELRIDADFTSMDRHRLEAAVARMLDSLGEK